MDQTILPTKSNLLQIKKQLALAKIGFDLLDRKRSIMLREMMQIIHGIGNIQEEINTAFTEAYQALQRANFTIGQSEVMDIAKTAPLDEGITLRTRSVMGVEIPDVQHRGEALRLRYGFSDTSSALDEAYLKFQRVKELTARLSAIENSVYRLAFAVKQAQKRANALKNISIPRLEETAAFITNYLEEKEREEFTSLKVIKNRKKAPSSP